MPHHRPNARPRPRTTLALLLATAGLTLGPPAVDAQAAPPVVTVTATTLTRMSATDCRGQHRTTDRGEPTITVHRTGDPADPLTVDVERTGPQAPLLPDPVTIPAGQASTTLTLDPDGLLQAGLQVVAGSGYEVGTPAAAQTQVLMAVADLGCNLGFPTRLEQTIILGGQPEPLATPGGAAPLTVEGGAPPGLTLAPDGTWTGAATELGTIRFSAYRCDDDGWCPEEVEITITVVAAPAEPPPAPPTQPPAPATPLPARATYTG